MKQINHPTVTNPVGNSCPRCCAASGYVMVGTLEPIDDDRCIALAPAWCTYCNYQWTDIYDYSKDIDKV